MSWCNRAGAKGGVAFILVVGCGDTVSESDSSTATEGMGGSASAATSQSGSGGSGGTSTTDANTSGGATGSTGGPTATPSECVNVASNGDKNCSDICGESGQTCVPSCYPQGVLEHSAAYYQTLSDCEDDTPLIFEVTACSSDSSLSTSNLFGAAYARCCCDGPATSTSSAGSGGSGGSSNPQGDACEVIDGQTYWSVDELECGLGPEGVVTCNWSIEFLAGVFLWSYSDIGETGSYTCDGDAIRGMAGGRGLDGSLDRASGELTWDGVVYGPAL